MLSIRETEKEYDLEILKLLEIEEQEYGKLKKIRLKMEKKEILEKMYAKEVHSEIQELKEIETKLEKLDIKILRKSYRNETRDLKIQME